MTSSLSPLTCVIRSIVESLNFSLGNNSVFLGEYFVRVVPLKVIGLSSFRWYSRVICYLTPRFFLFCFCHEQVFRLIYQYCKMPVLKSLIKKKCYLVDRDWFKKLLFFTNSLAKLLSDSLSLESLLLDILLSDSSIRRSQSKL